MAIPQTDSRADPKHDRADSQQNGVLSSKLSEACVESPHQQVEDLVLVGFGPANLSILIALQEDGDMKSLSKRDTPRITVLERQHAFAWHSGMQLPEAKMQINFLKDLATPRNPCSRFTFINYLLAKGRFNAFVNLGSFLPSRKEYEQYLTWCAKFFERRGLVRYGQEVLDIEPGKPNDDGKVGTFKVTSRDVVSGQITERLTRRVVVAVGGQAVMPARISPKHPAVAHSSQYAFRLANMLPDRSAAYSIVVLGGGQSAAEIFNDLPTRFPNARVTLVVKASALRPSDDSPFVNEIFNPDRVEGFFEMDETRRFESLRGDKATNYGVVRLELLEKLYERLYLQKLSGKESKIRILTDASVLKAENVKQSNRLRLVVGQTDGTRVDSNVDSKQETMEVDALFVATGYTRDAHDRMLKKTRCLLENAYPGSHFPVGKDYKIGFDDGKVEEQSGIWLQGCNESTHGLSDTLLSILATRSGQLVRSMFGGRRVQQRRREREELSARL